MDSDSLLLSKIEEAVSQHGGDLGGWTQLEDDELKLFDGRITLRAEVDPSDDENPGIVHAHVFSTLHEHDDEVLDACLMGIGDNREEGIAQAAFVWLTCVAGPIRSFMDNSPVCMTCQAGVADGDAAEGYVQGDYGLPGMRAFVGPSLARGFEDNTVAELDSKLPWFRYAATSAAPRRVHLAKASIMFNGEQWSRELEIDGHDVSFKDFEWPAPPASGPGYMVRYSVFEFPRNSKVIPVRAQIEKAIKLWLKNYNQFDEIDVLMEKMKEKGIHPQIVKQVESVSTIAFGRMFFEHLGIQYSPTVIRARKDGKIEPHVPLLSLPAYTRARALFGRVTETMSEEEIQNICFYNAESHAILQAMEDSKEINFEEISFFPCVVPDEGVSDETMERAMGVLQKLVHEQDSQTPEPGHGTPGVQKKPWWKFW